ncbi:MAG: inositol monophosphatase family protein [Deltaproteobacteria bacterium]|nr:inositol monophosphatase family protein [Deltaproteobacteria bacterium]
MDRRLEVAIAAAQAAGAVALRYFRTELQVERKADFSPVTVADREAEQAAVALLKEAYPQHGILGEEYGERGGDGPKWIIDPIDGTKSFIRGIPFFAALVALEEEGEITTGAVYAPALDDLLYAQKGQGAFDRQGPLRVSRIDTVRRAMLVFGGAGVLRSRGYWPAYERLVDASGRQRGYGDYFGYTFIARGQAEAMIDVDLKPWDLAALKIIIEEAGGRFTDFDGRATAYGGSAIASNGLVHDEIRALIAG